MALNVCVPTLVRYDLLEKFIESCEKSTVVPDNYYVIDNGGKWLPMNNPKIHVYTPSHNLGVAASWNWFLKNVPEIRVVCNDDIEVAPDAFEVMLKSWDEYKDKYLLYSLELNSFSFYWLSDYIVGKVGYFDETLSPGYAYFEDNDYHFRMKLLGFDIKDIPNVHVKHVGSATVNSLPQEEIEKHHTKYRLAEANYITKWGGRPRYEIYDTPYG